MVQGYCPICESWWRRRVGELCPKHDLELEADEPGTLHSGPSEAEGLAWVTVEHFPDSLAAAGARIRLDAEGIPTFLEGERMGSPGMYRVATGGVKLKVPAELVADARVLLSQAWSWPDQELDSDESEGPAIEEATPAPEAESPRGIVIELIVVLAIAIPLIAALIAHWHGE